MRIILLLITLLTIAFLVNKQLASSSPSTENEDITNNEKLTVPKVPTAAKDLDKFEKDINEFVLDAAKKRTEQID